MNLKQGAKRSSFKRGLGLVGLGSSMLFGTAALAGGVSIVYASLQMPESLMASWLVRPLAAAGLVTVGGSATVPVTIGQTSSQTGSGAGVTPTPTPTPTAATGALLPAKVGVNLTDPWWWNGQRAYANLLAADKWNYKAKGATKTSDIPADFIDADRNVIKLNPGDQAMINLAIPPAVQQGKSVDVICRWTGKGQVQISASAHLKNVVTTASTIRFTWLPGFKLQSGAFRLYSVDAANPVKGADCRETTMDPKAVFDPAFVAGLRKYNTLRYMMWQRINDNTAVSWADRTTATSRVPGVDGIALEHMIDLANQTKTNPWFNVPWNADEEYVRKFAEMVRDKLDPNLVAYVEVSNEVWNGVFKVAAQAQKEALARGMKNSNYRLGERTIEVMDIWSSVFAGKMSRIVRVMAQQHTNVSRIQEALMYKNVATKVDAISSAPYFGINFDAETYDPNNPESMFATLKKRIDERVAYMRSYRKVAGQYGLRYVAYEGGQHVIGKDVATNVMLQRDPRMGQLFSYYLDQWKANVGDLVTLFEDVDGAPGSFGAFGLQEYPGQPLSQAPKANAAQLFIASINNK